MLTLSDILAYVHVMALAMWFGGLFVYVLIVWPALTRLSEDGFPRAPLVMIGIGTTPWIYLAMVGALASLASWWVLADTKLPTAALTAYFALVLLLVANNVYSSLVAWPRIMLLPSVAARRAWQAFCARMFVSLALGLTALSFSLLFILRLS